jgi:hypothetical protein
MKIRSQPSCSDVDDLERRRIGKRRHALVLEIGAGAGARDLAHVFLAHAPHLGDVFFFAGVGGRDDLDVHWVLVLGGDEQGQHLGAHLLREFDARAGGVLRYGRTVGGDQDLAIHNGSSWVAMHIQVTQCRMAISETQTVEFYQMNATCCDATLTLEN